MPIDAFFFRYARARVKSDGGQDLTEHLRRIGAKFLVSAVARALRPGCQLDTMVVLEGPEGAGKTSLLRILFGQWYVCTKLNLDDKDTLAVGASNWGVELGELGAIGRAEDLALLAYTTKLTDKFRPPYARRAEDFPRRSVMVATTNVEKWLTPGKGLRRWWPVWIEAIDLAATAADRDQLWAEAVVRFRGYVDALGIQHPPERWHLVEEEWKEANVEANVRIEDTYVQQKIESWYYRQEPNRRPEHLTLIEIVEKCLELATNRVGAKQAEIGHAMTRLGFMKGRAPDGRRCWVASEAVRMRGVALAPAMTRGEAVAAIAGVQVPASAFPSTTGGVPR